MGARKRVMLGFSVVVALPRAHSKACVRSWLVGGGKHRLRPSHGAVLHVLLTEGLGVCAISRGRREGRACGWHSWPYLGVGVPSRVIVLKSWGE